MTSEIDQTVLVKSVNGQQGDVSVEFTSSLTTEGVISTEAPDTIGIEAAVRLLIDDKVPRGEALLDFLLSYEDTAEAITGSEAFMYVINNEGQFSNREENPTPQNFDTALTLLDDPAARLIAYTELLLADYDQGQSDLQTLMDSPPAARQLGDSPQAMRVINDGDDRPDLQDYRTDESSSGAVSLTSTDTAHELNNTEYTAVPWDTVRLNDGPYSRPTNTEIQVDSSGTYKIATVIAQNGGSARTNVKVRLRKNGDLMDGSGKSSYIRATDGHNESSSSLSLTAELAADDTIEVVTQQEASGGSVTMDSRESLFELQKIA